MATARERHPELYQPVSGESPRGKKRTVPMECLCLGFNRTGTATMTTALEVLGIHCFHSVTFFSNNFADIEMWQEAVDRKFFGAGPKFDRVEFDQLLHDFGAVSSDTPAIAFSEELIEAYPDARVVLVDRDIDSWFNPFLQLAHNIDRWYLRPIARIHITTLRGWMGIWNPEDARQKSKAKFREHYAMVRKLTPKDWLLEFKLADGWGPLCAFLGKPVPDQTFPHVNEKKWLDEKVQLAAIRGLKALAWKTGVFGAPVALGIVGYFVYMKA